MSRSRHRACRQGFKMLWAGFSMLVCAAALPAQATDGTAIPAEKPEAPAAASVQSSASSNGSYDKVREVFSGDKTIAGEKITFPQKDASVRAIVVTLEPGETTAWHQHGAPLFAYILQGEVSVFYEGIGEKVFGEGEGLMEAMAVTHQGRNTADGETRILAVFMLGDGKEAVLPDDAPVKGLH
ncbi:cupin domain-containing protein [Roseibium sp. MMSF_3412]|uniref:cupin domain-containing protein n=1 Tax=Roseibium sp. MMSF_3412 TaxID=3046712 RepID=UPI00273FC9AE|nr:cupin domain-containing protein [Roseibium sp. MMSF_3412]